MTSFRRPSYKQLVLHILHVVACAALLATRCSSFIAPARTTPATARYYAASREPSMFNFRKQQQRSCCGTRYNFDVISTTACGRVASLQLDRQRLQRRWREGGAGVGGWGVHTVGLLMAPSPPDDFIDTTIIEEEGSSYVGVDYERQELRVIFENMDKNNVFYKMLDVEQIAEILTMTQALLRVRQMPVDISKLCEGDGMKGKWKLEFSTEERYKLLPVTTDIYNYIYDGNGGGRMDNIIRFYKSAIVKSVRAVTKYTMDRRGRLVFDFERIESDLFGFKIPLPRFGQDTAFVEMQYFDGDLWIEAFEAPLESNKDEMGSVINIYRRVGDVTEEDKTSIPERKGGIGQAQR